VTPEEELQLWARWRLALLLLQIAEQMREEAHVRLAAAARLDCGA
jgi:hypothetical protein